MPQAGFDPGAIARDNDFLKATPADKIAYLSAQDPEFAKASRADQIGYIQHLVGQMQPVNEGPPKPGFMSTALSDLGGMAKGLYNTVVNNAIPESTLVPQSIRSKIGLAPPPDPMAQGQQMREDFARRKQEGYNLAYRLGAPVAEQLGANVTGMEQSAKQGDVGGVLGHTAIPMAVAAAPLGIEGAARVANRVIPSTTRAGLGLNALTDSPEAAFAKQPLEFKPNEPTKALETARKIRNELEITNEKPHPIIQHFMEQPAGAVNLYEARTMLKRVNDIIRNSKGFNADVASKTATTNLKRFAGALDEDITNAANHYGFGKDYAAMRNEYRAGQGIIRGGEEIGAPVGALVGYTVGRELGEPLGGTLAGGMVGKAIGRKTTGAAARALVERNAGPPRLHSLPPTPEAYTRTILDAKEGLISPEEANRRIQRAGGSIRTRPIPKPTE